MTTPIRRAAYHRIVERAFYAAESIDHDLAGSLLVEGVISRLYRRADENHWHAFTGTLARRSCLRRFITRGDKSVSPRLWDAILDRLIEEGLVAQEADDAGKPLSLTVYNPSRLKVSDRGAIEGLITKQEAETLTKKAKNEEAENTPKTVPDRDPDRDSGLTRIPCAQQTADRKPQSPELKPPSSQNEHEHVLTRRREAEPTDSDLDSDSGLRLIDGDLSWTAASTRRLFESVWAASRPGTPYAAARQENDRAEQLAGLLVKAGWGSEQCSARIEDYLAEHAAGRAFPQPVGGVQQRTGLPQFLAVVRRELLPKPSRSAPVEDGQMIDGYWYSAAELRQMEASG